MGRRPWRWLLRLLLLPGATEAGGVLLPCCGDYRDGLLLKTLREVGVVLLSLSE